MSRGPDRRTAPRIAVLGLGWFPDQAGGLNRYVVDLVGALGADARAVVIGPAAGAPPEVSAVSSHDAPLLRRVWAYSRAARRAARDADVVDAHFALYAAVPLLMPSVRRLPVVVHFHGPWAEESRSGDGGTGGAIAYRARRAVERFVLRRADRVVVLSEAFADVVVDHGGVPRERVVVVRPGVDGARFTPGDRTLARRRLGLPDSGFVVLAARRLVPRTGVDVLLSAWSVVTRTRDAAESGDACLLVVGDGPARVELEAMAAVVDADVRMTGSVADAVLVDAYRAADVSVVPSRALEGFGLVALESLACGTPVVVTDVGGLPEVVEGLDGDLVVPAGDADALAARLLGAIDGSRPLPTEDACCERAAQLSAARSLEAHRRIYADVAGGPGARLRVVVVDHTARLSGGEIALLRLLEGLRAPAAAGVEVEVEVEVVCFEDGPLVDRLHAMGVGVEVLPLGGGANDLSRTRAVPGRVPVRALAGVTVQVVRLARWLRRRRPDLVHVNSLKSGVIGSVAATLAGVPVVWHLRDRLAPDYLPAATARVLRWWIPRASSVVIVTSQTTRSALAPPAGAHVHVVPDPYRAPASVRRRGDGSRDAGEPPPRGLRVGMVGRIAPWKGQHVFVDAFARAFPTGPETAVVAGTPMFGETDYAEALVQRVDRLGLAGRVTFAGFVDDVPALLAELDVLVHASVVPEPHGQVVVEGMAAGVAVVAAGAGGPVEIVTPGVDGLIVPPDDVEALAAALVALAEDPELRRRLGAAARRRAAAFDPDRVIPQVLRAYQDASRGSCR